MEGRELEETAVPGSVAEGDFAGKFLADAADAGLHGAAQDPKFTGQHRDGRSGFPAFTESVGGLQPFGAAQLSAQFHRATFLLFAFGASTGHLLTADDAAGRVAEPLSDLTDIFARDAVFSCQNNVGGDGELADEFLPAGDGKLPRDAGVASPAQQSSGAEEFPHLERVEPEAPGCVGRGQVLAQVQAQQGGLLSFRERLVVRAFN